MNEQIKELARFSPEEDWDEAYMLLSQTLPRVE